MINEIHYTDNQNILLQMEDNSVDMILEDMPYNTTNLDFEYEVNLVACLKEGRNFIVCENNEQYFLKAKKRIQNAKLQKEFTLDL